MSQERREKPEVALSGGNRAMFRPNRGSDTSIQPIRATIRATVARILDERKKAPQLIRQYV